jgi:hypothetical protein
MRLVICLMLWLFVAFVSAYDTYLNVRHPVTAATELNPMARFLLQASDNDLALLIATKLFGTTIVLSFLLLALFYKRNNAYVVVFCVAMAQLAVLMYLNYS